MTIKQQVQKKKKNQRSQQKKDNLDTPSYSEDEDFDEFKFCNYFSDNSDFVRKNGRRIRL